MIDLIKNFANYTRVEVKSYHALFSINKHICLETHIDGEVFFKVKIITLTVIKQYNSGAVLDPMTAG